MIRLLFSFFLLVLQFSSFAQNREIISPNFERVEISVEPGKYYTITSSRKITSMVIKCNTLQDFDSAYVLTGTDTLFLKKDYHNSSELFFGSELLYFNEPLDSLIIYTGKLNSLLSLNLLNASLEVISGKSFRVNQEIKCPEPVVILPEFWREGLPDPKNSPVPTDVNHIIIHHSAGPVNTTDYVSLVRNIYLLHTEVNGWDDIGYNFLIAPDGTIFQGRDDKGLYDKDNVLGAHMCGKNSNTMGICLLGDFTTVSPEQDALHSLYVLCAWKAAKESIDLSSGGIHPIGPSGSGVPDSYLPNLAGHRDGCKSNYTMCPGNTFYPMLPAVRDSSNHILKNCAGMVSGLFSENRSFSKIFPQPVSDIAYIQSEKKWIQAFFLDMHGNRVKSILSDGSPIKEFSLGDLNSGIYIIQIFYRDGSFERKKVVFN